MFHENSLGVDSSTRYDDFIAGPLDADVPFDSLYTFPMNNDGSIVDQPYPATMTDENIMGCVVPTVLDMFPEADPLGVVGSAASEIQSGEGKSKPNNGWSPPLFLPEFERTLSFLPYLKL
jgi:hypothetical protein